MPGPPGFGIVGPEIPPASQESPVVSVTVVGSLPIPVGSIEVPQPPVGRYTGYGVTVALFTDEGLRGSPLAGPKGTQAVVWRTHAGLTYKIVDWVAEMLDADPPVPAPITCDNEVLMSRSISLPSKGQAANGVEMTYRFGRYVFLLQKTPEGTDVLYGCATPLSTTGLSQNVLDPGKFVTNLIGPIPNPAGFTGVPITF